MILKCLAIDDEPLALDIIEDYISKCPFLKLVKKSTSAIDAFMVLKQEKIDLIFLDIQMPELSGLDFLKSLHTPPKVIFTTAYDKFAVESYDLNAVDYLLKPISFERFFIAINKVIENLKLKGNSPVIQNKQPKTGDYFFLYTGQDIVKVMLDDICCIKGLKDYVEVIATQHKYVIRQNMNTLEEQLSPHGFIRVHKSYIVAKNKIDRISGNMIYMNNHAIPIGSVYKNMLIKEINSQKLGK